MNRSALFLTLASASLFAAPRAGAVPGHEEPFAHTFSIVARDSLTGEIGVAVQSHWFSVGQVVPWAEPGVGAVATQSLVKVSYGPRGLELMRQGMSAPEALARLLAEDPDREVRQVAMIDAEGRVAVHTGSQCIPEAGHVKSDQFSTQANLMLNDTVWGGMAKAYREAAGDLASRLMAALNAAEAKGGDIRGRQSAAILIVKGEKVDEPGTGRVFDLRVDDSDQPLPELARLIQLQRAYNMANHGDDLVAARKFTEAMAAYGESTRLAPGNLELQFWAAASMFKEGHEAEALPMFRDIFAKDGDWAVLVPRLKGLDSIAEGDAAFARAVEKILAVAPGPARKRAEADWAKRR